MKFEINFDSLMALVLAGIISVFMFFVFYEKIDSNRLASTLKLNESLNAQMVKAKK